MTDRKPGAPGQYAAVITAGELEKLRSGEQFIITLTRDDQPIAEGTPYSKAAVLPDALAALICPGVADPTPADALKGLLPRNGSQPMTGPLAMGGNKITGLADPVDDADAVNKGHMDGKLTKFVQLWRNASWSSAFAAQTVIFEDTTAYDAYIVTFVYSVGYGYTMSILINSKNVYQGREGCARFAPGVPFDGAPVTMVDSWRYCSIVSSGCNFGPGYHNGGANNNYAIPGAVYGIKW